MSPSEAELRAALRRGEHDAHPDPDAVLALARGARRQRRTRVLASGAAAVVVAGVAVAAVTLAGGGSDGRRAAGGTPSPVPTVPTRSSAAATSCPVDLPAYPAGGSAGGRGNGPIFSGTVTSLSICAYDTVSGVTSPVLPDLVVLGGTDATRLASSLDDAPSDAQGEACPAIAYARQRTLVITDLSGSSRQLPVSVQFSPIACQRVVSNGSATRYDWTPPAGLLPTALTEFDQTLPVYSPASPAGPVSGTAAVTLTPAGPTISGSLSPAPSDSAVPGNPAGPSHGLSGSPLH